MATYKKPQSTVVGFVKTRPWPINIDYEKTLSTLTTGRTKG